MKFGGLIKRIEKHNNTILAAIDKGDQENPKEALAFARQSIQLNAYYVLNHEKFAPVDRKILFQLLRRSGTVERDYGSRFVAKYER